MFKSVSSNNLKLVAGFIGPAGSGKTLSALRVARGLVGPNGKIAVASTEQQAPAAYRRDVEFDMAELNPPYTMKALLNCVQNAKDGGYDVIIVDSLSNFYTGTGGLVDFHNEIMIKDNKNNWQAWEDVQGWINKMWEKIRTSGIHVFLTLRTKTAYSVEKNDRGKDAPKKTGLAPIWKPDPGIEYELDCIMNINSKHYASFVSKRLRHLNDQLVHEPDENFGNTLRAYLNEEPITGTPPGAKVILPPAPVVEAVTEEGSAEVEKPTARAKLMAKLEDLAVATGKDDPAVWFQQIAEKLGKESIDKVTQKDLTEVIKKVEAKIASGATNG